MKMLALAMMAYFTGSALAAGHHHPSQRTVSALASLKLLEKLKIPVLASDRETDLAYASLTPEAQARVLEANHKENRCGGFEALPDKRPSPILGSQLLRDYRARADKDKRYREARPAPVRLAKKPEIEAAIALLQEENIRRTVEWLSNYHNRDNRATDPNVHVRDFESYLSVLLSGYPHPWKVELIDHDSTGQKSVRVHLEGKSRPSELVILGGHLDSINNSWNGVTRRAPGADDNASGSSNLLEALRVTLLQPRPERSLEFFWYAGEESGLLGSNEIARAYKLARKDVVAVLQLDMTLFPGAGDFTIASISDNTSAWLRDYLAALNNNYVGARIEEESCGYACSDHASWYRQGYPTVYPFESAGEYNRKIHTPQDAINPDSSFRHSLVFAKLVLAFALDLANSAQRQPY